MTGKRLEASYCQRRQQAFKITGLTWIVERSFAWLGRDRRFSKYHECRVQPSETLLVAPFLAGLYLFPMEERKVDPGRGIGNYMFAADGEFGAEALGLNPTKFRVRRANYNAIAIVRP